MMSIYSAFQSLIVISNTREDCKCCKRQREFQSLIVISNTSYRLLVYMVYK